MDGGKMKADKIEGSGRTHSHEFLIEEVDPYPCFNTDFFSEIHSGDVCPRCGVAIEYSEDVIRFDGERGVPTELATKDFSIPLYHPKCYRKRKADKQDLQSLDDY